MTDEADARLACEVLCCSSIVCRLWRVHDGGESGDWIAMVDFEGPGLDEWESYVVDLATLLLAAALRDAPALDVGPCPACADHETLRDALAEFWIAVIEQNETITPWSMERWIAAIRDIVFEHTGEWREMKIRQDADDPTRCDVASIEDLVGTCPACAHDGHYLAEDGTTRVGDGKPTGRQIVSAPEDVLMAAASYCGHCSGRSYVIHAPGYHRETSPCGICQGEGHVLGHAGARAALVRLAATWREHLPVLADWLEGRGLFRSGDPHDPIFVLGDAGVWDPPGLSLKLFIRNNHGGSVADWIEKARFDSQLSDVIGVCPHVPLTLAECPALPMWIEAWLDGKCTASTCLIGESQFCSDCDMTGLAIGPHIPAIRARLQAIAEEDAAEQVPAEATA